MKLSLSVHRTKHKDIKHSPLVGQPIFRFNDTLTLLLVTSRFYFEKKNGKKIGEYQSATN